MGHPREFAKQALDWWRSLIPDRWEPQGIDPNELEHMARELSLTAKDLVCLCLDRSGPEAGELMARMMIAKGVDISALRSAYPLVVRDMERCCTLCGAKARCRGDLDSGNAFARFEGYCANAPTIIEFGDKRNRRHAA